MGPQTPDEQRPRVPGHGWRAASAVQRRLGAAVASLYRRAWPILGGLALGATALGTWGFLRLPAQGGATMSVSDALYAALQLFVLQMPPLPAPLPWQLDVARFIAAAVAGGTVLRALVMVSYDQFELALLGLLGHDHVIVCGLGRKGSALVTDLRARDEWVVVIENDPDNPELERCRELGAVVLIGSATSERTLRRAGVSRAKALVAVLGSDGANVEIAVTARLLSAGRTQGNLRCVIQVVDRQLNEMLRKTEIANRENDPFDLVLFNAYEECARLMLGDSLSSTSSAVADRTPHLLVVGFGQLGETLATQAVLEWKNRGTASKLRLTVIDRSAQSKETHFRLLHADAVQACELIFRQLDVRQSQFAGGTFLHDLAGLPELTAAYVCLGDDTLGMYAALRLADVLRPRRVPIMVRMSERKGLAAALRTHRADSGFVDGVRAIGLVELTCTAARVLDGNRNAGGG